MGSDKLNIAGLAERCMYNQYYGDSKYAERSIKSFLDGVFDCLGIKECTDLMKKGEYDLSGYIETYFVNMYQHHGIPRGKMVLDAFEFPSELTKECLMVAKNFIDNNLTDDLYKRIKETAIHRKDKIVESFGKIPIRQNITREIEKFEFFLIGRKISFGDIDNFLLEVQHCYESGSRNDGEHLIERDITLINFMRLPGILKDIEKQLKDEIAREVIQKFI